MAIVFGLVNVIFFGKVTFLFLYVARGESPLVKEIFLKKIIFLVLPKVLIGQDLGHDVTRAENIGAGRIFSPRVKCWCLRRDASSSFLEFGDIS